VHIASDCPDGKNDKPRIIMIQWLLFNRVKIDRRELPVYFGIKLSLLISPYLACPCFAFMYQTFMRTEQTTNLVINLLVV
jgi:hypothetical protein